MTRISKDNPKWGHPKRGDAAPGQLALSRWTNKNYPEDIQIVMSGWGKTRKKDSKRTTSDKTAENRAQHLNIVMSKLREINRGISTLSQLKPKYIPDIIKAWVEAGLAESTQVQYYGTLRWFWQLHGIKVGSIKDYAPNPEDYVIYSAARRDKSVSAVVADMDEFFARVRADDQRFGLFVELAHVTGLRKRECLCLDPHGGDKGDSIIVDMGAKGGKYREVDLRLQGPEAYARARRVLDDFKRITKHGDRAGWPGKSLKQNENHLAYRCRKNGLTNEKLGATFHGLRAGYANDSLEKLGGEISPVRGGMFIDYTKLREHQRLVSRQMGHNRPKITASYLGQSALMRSKCRKPSVPPAT